MCSEERDCVCQEMIGSWKKLHGVEGLLVMGTTLGTLPKEIVSVGEREATSSRDER